jgi:hypothetical protein
VYEHG